MKLVIKLYKSMYTSKVNKFIKFGNKIFKTFDIR